MAAQMFSMPVWDAGGDGDTSVLLSQSCPVDSEAQLSVPAQSQGVICEQLCVGFQLEPWAVLGYCTGVGHVLFILSELKIISFNGVKKTWGVVGVRTVVHLWVMLWAVLVQKGQNRMKRWRSSERSTGPNSVIEAPAETFLKVSLGLGTSLKICYQWHWKPQSHPCHGTPSTVPGCSTPQCPTWPGIQGHPQLPWAACARFFLFFLCISAPQSIKRSEVWNTKKIKISIH